jgi:hypothetical protein
MSKKNNFKNIMNNWEDYLIKTRRKNRKPMNENQAQQLKQKVDDLKAAYRESSGLYKD